MFKLMRSFGQQLTGLMGYFVGLNVGICMLTFFKDRLF